MHAPADLSKWNLDTIRQLVAVSEYEPGWFDFKEALKESRSGQDPDLPHSIRRTACAMANADGGYLIFGVKDRRKWKDGKDPLVGIELRDDVELRKHFGDHVAHIRRGIRFDTAPGPILIPSDERRGVFVVNVLASPLRPHEYLGVFYRRGDGGVAIPMDIYEVRAQMLFTEERISKLTLLRIELDQLSKVNQYISREDPTLCAYRFETASIPSLIADTCGLFPPGNDLLRGLSKVVTFAREANELLNMMSDAGYSRPGNMTRRNAWATELGRAKDAIEDICRRVEAKLLEMHGPIKP